MSFPEIRTIDDVLPAIAHKPEFCVHKDSNGFTSIFYNITGTDTFDSPVAKECRGIVFDQKREDRRQAVSQILQCERNRCHTGKRHSMAKHCSC